MSSRQMLKHSNTNSIADNITFEAEDVTLNIEINSLHDNFEPIQEHIAVLPIYACTSGSPHDCECVFSLIYKEFSILID